MSFSQIWFVLLVDTINSVTASQTKVNQPDLGLVSFAKAQQQIGALDVGMHVLLVVNVFQYVDDSQRQINDCVNWKPALGSVEQFLDIRSETLHYHKTVFLSFVFVRAGANKTWHPKKLHLFCFNPFFN